MFPLIITVVAVFPALVIVLPKKGLFRNLEIKAHD